MCIYRSECSYVYKYLCLYYVLKKTLRISMDVARYKYWQSASLMARRREAAGFTSLLH
jgi:hypothetical protein